MKEEELIHGGASKGFGREWAQAALERGDRVAATAREPETLDALVETYGDGVLPLTLDVTDRGADQAAVQRAAEHFGVIEELTEDELRSQLETKLFGAVWVTEAALPIMREQGSGHIIQVSSVGGISAFPTIGAYHASKWALEALSQSLAQEVAGFGIHVTLIEPGGYSTDWSAPPRCAARRTLPTPRSGRRPRTVHRPRPQVTPPPLVSRS